ncbi:MAG: ABC transporter permease [Lachnospiraceae bacterium]|nr:ABC transporter permease [Lachnospiraceae bacterium]
MLIRNMLRNLLKNKVQFISIFIMSFLGLFVFVGMDSEVAGFTQAEEAFYNEYALPDIWVRGQNFYTDDLDKVKSLEGVEDVERRASLKGKFLLPDREADMYLNFIEANNLSRIAVISGEEYAPGKSGIWIDYVFAEKNGLANGDRVKLKYEGKTFDETVRGMIRNPEYVYFLQDSASMMPDYGFYGMAFLDSSEYPVDGDVEFNELIIDAAEIDNTVPVNDDEKAVRKRLENEIREVLENDTLAVLDKDDQLSYQTFRAEMDQHRGMSFMFPVVFMLISVLGIITTMTRLTKRQRIQIGTLKALGLSKTVITLHYVSYGFFLSLTGSVLGALAGYRYIVELVLTMMSDTYLIPNAHGKITFSGIFVIAASVAVATIVSFLSCRHELKYPPAETLRPEAPKNMKPSLIEKSALWKKLGFSSQWNLRDVRRNKARTIMGIIGVAGSTMLMLSAFGCLDSIEFITDWMYGQLNTAGYQIVMKEDTSYEDVYEYARKYRGQMLENTAAVFEAGEIEKNGTVTVLEKGSLYHFQDDDFQSERLTESGIAMSAKMARSLNIWEGDFVRWHLTGDDKWQKDRVVQIYANPGTQGISMYRKVYEQHEYKFEPKMVLTNMDSAKDLDDDIVLGVQDTRGLMRSMDEMKKMMYTMMAIFISAAVILGVVVLYNQGILSYVEKIREMATLKVLGFTTGKIRLILQLQNVWITIAGIILGIPLGKLLLYGIMADMPESMDYRGIIFTPSYLYSAVGTFILSSLVSVFLSRKVHSVDMVEALKGIE